MFKIGDNVKTLPVATNSDLANSTYANREAIVTAIRFPFGLHTLYEVEFTEPFFDFGYEVKKHSYYDWQNALQLLD